MSLIKPLCFFMLESDAPKNNYVQDVNYQIKTEFVETVNDSSYYNYPSTINLKTYNNCYNLWTKE